MPCEKWGGVLRDIFTCCRIDWKWSWSPSPTPPTIFLALLLVWERERVDSKTWWCALLLCLTQFDLSLYNYIPDLWSWCLKNLIGYSDLNPKRYPIWMYMLFTGGLRRMTSSNQQVWGLLFKYSSRNTLLYTLIMLMLLFFCDPKVTPSLMFSPLCSYMLLSQAGSNIG